MKTFRSTLPPFKRFINLLLVDKQEILIIYMYALFNGLVALSLPLGIQAIINLIQGGQISTSWMVLVAVVIAGVGLSGTMQIMQVSINENIQQKIFTRSAFEFAYRIPRIQFNSLQRKYLPELVNRFFDTLSIQKGLAKILLDFSGAALQIVFGLLLLSLYHPFFILFSVLLLVLIFVIYKYTVPQGLTTSLLESKYKYQVAHWLEEIGRAMATFKLAGKTPFTLEKTDKLLVKYLKARKSHFRTLKLQFINLVAFKVIITAGLLLIGSLLVFNQQMNIGQFVAAEIIIILVLNSVEKLIVSMETIYDVVTAAEKIGQVTDMPLDNTKGIKLGNHEEALSIQFKNVTVQHGLKDANIFTNLNLDIPAGSKTCLVGDEGAGKSLFLQMCSGIFNPDQGMISYDDTPRNQWQSESLLSQIGDSLTKEDIFNGTIYENITLGKENVAKADAMRSCEILGLDKYIKSLPKGLETELTAEGGLLPKSARLKMMLARCITGDSKLILLEDSFQLLHPEDKKRFINYVLSKPWTVVAVSNAKRIVEQFPSVLLLREDAAPIAGTPQEILSRSDYQTFICE